MLDLHRAEIQRRFDSDRAEIAAQAIGLAWEEQELGAQARDAGRARTVRCRRCSLRLGLEPGQSPPATCPRCSGLAAIAPFEGPP